MSSATETTDIEGNVPAPPAPGATIRSIGEALAGHSNSLGFIRLLLAAVVIFDHAFPLGGFGADPLYSLTRGQASLGSIAVDGFFAISGYLIAKSGLSADILQFLWRRFLRIFPAYWVVLVVTAFIVIPIVWIAQGDSLAAYFHFAPEAPYRFVYGNFTLNIHTYGIWDVFATTTPYGREIHASAVNGSIWTLIYEWNCYLLIGLLLVFGVLRNAKIVVPIITVFLFILEVVLIVDPKAIPTFVPWLSDQYTIMLTLTFMIGSCIAVYSKRVPYSWGLGILSAAVFVYTLHYGGFQVVGVPAGVYLVLFLGARLPTVFHRVGVKTDYSYGVYIWGFLVEQVLARVGLYRLGYAPFAIVSLVLSLGLAWLSWHTIEKRAMGLKDWGPGRGLRYWWDRIQTRRKSQPLTPEVT